MGEPLPVEWLDKGMNTTDPPFRLADGEVQSAQDCNFKDRCATKRDGSLRLINQADGPAALQFDSTTLSGVFALTPYVRIPDHADFRQRTNQTIEVRFKCDTLPAIGVLQGETLLAKGRFSGVATDGEYRFYLRNVGSVVTARVDWYTASAVLITLTSTSAISAGAKVHLAVVKTGASLQLVVNGVAEGAPGVVGTFTPVAPWPVVIGATMTQGDGNLGMAYNDSSATAPTFGGFKGTIAEVRFWNIARSIANINTYKDRWLDSRDPDIQSTPGVYTGNLKGYYHLNEGRGFTVNGTPTSAPAYFAANDTAKVGVLCPTGPQSEDPLIASRDRQHGCVRVNAPSVSSPNQYDDVIAFDRAPNDTAGDRFWSALKDTVEAAPANWTVEFRVGFRTVTAPQVVFWYSRYVGDAAAPEIYMGIRIETEAATSRLFGFARDALGVTRICGGGAGATVAAGTEIHVALVRAGAVLKLYVNGVLTGTNGTLTSANGPTPAILNTTTFTPDFTDMCFGAAGTTYGLSAATTVYVDGGAVISQTVRDRFYGSADVDIQEVRFWNVDRSSIGPALVNKILELAGAELYNVNTERTGLLGYFPMGDDRVDTMSRQPVSARDDSTARVGFFLYPPSNPPMWHSGIVDRTFLDGDSTSILAKPEGIRGLFNFRTLSDTFLLMKRQGSSFAVITQALNGTPTTAWLETQDGRDKTTLEFFAGYRNRIYSSDGAGPILRYDGTNHQFCGIQPPVIEPREVAAVAAGTALQNNQFADYVYTGYNSTIGIESNPSPPIRIQNTSGGAADITISLAGLQDPQVDRLRIYRNQSAITAPASVNLFLVGEVPNPMSSTLSVDFTDRTPNGNLNIALAVNPTQLENDPPPDAAGPLLVFRDRLYAVDGEDREILRFSSKENPDAWPATNFLLMDTRDGAAISGLGAIYDIGVAFKTTAIYHWMENSDGTAFQLQKMHDGIGCVAPLTVIPLDQGILFFLSNRGPMLYDGQRPLYLGWEIESEFKTWNKSRLAFAVAAYHKLEGLLYLSVTRSASGTQNDTIYVLDLRAFVGDPAGNPNWIRYTEPPVWSRYSIQASTLLSTIDAVGEERLFYGDEFGYVYRLGVATNDGVGIVLPPAAVSANSLFGTVGSGGVVQLTQPPAIRNTASNWATVSGDGLRGVRLRYRYDNVAIGGASVQDFVILGNDASDTARLSAAFAAAGATGDQYKIGFIDFDLKTRERPVQENMQVTDVQSVRLVTSNPAVTTTLRVQAASNLEDVVGDLFVFDLATQRSTPFCRIQLKYARGRTTSVRIQSEDPDTPLILYGIVYEPLVAKDH